MKLGSTTDESPIEKPVHNNNNNNNNNNHVVKHEDDLKREEEMVEDEMKESENEEELDDNEEQIHNSNPNVQADHSKDSGIIKDFGAKNEEIISREEITTTNNIDPTNATTSPPPPHQPNLTDSLKQLQLNWLKKMYDDLSKNKNNSTNNANTNSQEGQQQQQQQNQQQQPGIACKFQCGKMFNSPLELFSHQESCNNNESNQYEESLMSDTNETDFANGLNTSNSSGDERKVRVRTLISDEQLSILKTYYNHNPRYVIYLRIFSKLPSIFHWYIYPKYF